MKVTVTYDEEGKKIPSKNEREREDNVFTST